MVAMLFDLLETLVLYSPPFYMIQFVLRRKFLILFCLKVLTCASPTLVMLFYKISRLCAFSFVFRVIFSFFLQDVLCSSQDFFPYFPWYSPSDVQEVSSSYVFAPYSVYSFVPGVFAAFSSVLSRSVYSFKSSP